MVGENNLPAAELMGAGQVAETEQLEPPAGLSIAGVVQKGAVVGEAAGEVVDQTLDFDVIAQGRVKLLLVYRVGKIVALVRTGGAVCAPFLEKAWERLTKRRASGIMRSNCGRFAIAPYPY